MMGNNVGLSFIDLFSGAGGFSYGFVSSGFRDLLAIEKNGSAANTYHLNFPEAIVVNNDVRDIHSLAIEKELEGQNVDVILASPPCEPFTSANIKRKKTAWKRFYETENGDLIFHALRVIADLEPSFFVIENVVPMIEDEGKEILKDAFADIGIQDIFFNILYAEKNGCPSARRRVFITNFPIKLKQPNKEVTVRKALDNLPNPAYPHDVPNHFLTPFPERVLKKLSKIGVNQAAVYYKGSSGEKVNWLKINPDNIAPTIMGKSRFIHYEVNRPLTVREHARLMSFPDNFVFTGTIEEMYNQAGEAVPPVISQLIAKSIIEVKTKKIKSKF